MNAKVGMGIFFFLHVDLDAMYERTICYEFCFWGLKGGSLNLVWVWPQCSIIVRNVYL